MNKPVFNDSYFLALCKEQIQLKLGWGDSGLWSNQDFLALSEKILEATGVRLSGTTLKRIWGKVRYDSIPHTSTLNVLAQYLGYESWLAFRNTNSPDLKPTSAEKIEHGKSSKKHAHLLKTGIWVGFLLVGLIIISFVYHPAMRKISEEDVAQTLFESKKVVTGVPNTVVFKYDVRHLPGNDFMIQQYWDTRKRFRIEKSLQEATSTYYYPGYRRAKLLANGRVIKEHDIYIKSNGWMAAIENEGVPRYLLSNELIRNDQLTVSEAVLEEINASLEAPKWLSYHYVEDFGGLDADNLIFEAALKNTYEKGDGVCKNTRILLLATESAAIIPLSAPGCIGNIGLMFSDQYLDGKKHDLSAFGYQHDDWHIVRCEIKDKQVKLFLNGSFIYETAYNKSLGALAGMRFKFIGSGAVKYVKIQDSNKKLIFEETFGGREEQVNKVAINK